MRERGLGVTDELCVGFLSEFFLLPRKLSEFDWIFNASYYILCFKSCLCVSMVPLKRKGREREMEPTKNKWVVRRKERGDATDICTYSS